MPRKTLKDIRGEVFGNWFVREYAGNSHWRCRCRCGTEREVSSQSLRNGASVSCGCLRLPPMPVILDNCESVGSPGCWVWKGRKNRKGYGVVWHNYRPRAAHREAWKQANGDIPPGVCVLHTCDNPACCRPDHLFLGTHADNVTDKMRKGRHRSPTGERHGMNRLTETAVREILAHPEVSASVLAREHRVSEACIRDIRKRRTWRHLILNKE